MFAEVFSYDNELIATGIQQGEENKAIEIARTSLTKGLDIETVTLITGLDLDTVLQLQNSLSNS